MFKKNTRHLPILLPDHVDELPEMLRHRLCNSWAEPFYRQCFWRPDEEPFGVLYADVPLRPNVPVNVERSKPSPTGPLYGIVTTADNGETFDGRVVDAAGRVLIELKGYRTVARPV